MSGFGRSRLAAIAALGAAALVVFVFVGRWERARNASVQNARMAAVYRLATSDGLSSKRLYAYRLAFGFDCLVYWPPRDPKATNALELCFDAHGRLVETIDRQTGTPAFASLLDQPSLAALRVSPRRLLGAFATAGAFRHDRRFAGVSRSQDVLPVTFDDVGALHFPHVKPPAGGG